MKKLLSKLAPPRYERLEKSRQAELLNGVSLVLLVLLVILLLLNRYYDIGLGNGVNPVLAGLIVCQGIAQILIRTDHVRLGGLSLLFLSWLGITWFALLADGVRDVVLFAYITILLGAGYMFGWRAFVWFTACSILAIWFLTLYEIKGWIHPTLASPARIALYLTALFILISLQIYYILNTLKKSLAESTYENHARREIEEVLREEKEKLNFALDAAKMGTWSWDIESGNIEWSPKIEVIFGMENGQLDGKYSSYISLVHPDDLQKVEATIQRALDDQDFLYFLEHRVVSPKGDVLWIEGRGNVYRDQNDRPVRMAGTLVDITERKHAEEAVRLAEEKYRNIFENSAHGIFQSTAQGRFLSVNPAMARIYGYPSPAEFLSSVMEIAQQLYLNEADWAEFIRVLETSTAVSGFEVKNRKQDGSIIFVTINARVVRDEAGNPLYYEGTVEDITQRKEAEAERERLLGELASKNAELERFVYTVSHDLKSPLVTIQGFLGYLDKDIQGQNMAAVKKDIDRISRAAARMQDLLKDLLDLSRIGRVMNAPETVPFENLVKEALELTEGHLREKQVQVEIQANLPDVTGDAKRLLELVQNLIDNAAKYMGDQPEPLIEIGTCGVESGKPILFVRDNGIGIAPEHHERIFGLFNKLDPSVEGTGVGLALCKRIVEVHGGRIWVESTLGRGTIFLFTLPGGFED